MIFRKTPKLYEFRVSQTPEKAAMALATDIVEHSEKMLHSKNRCVWALSGGSSILKLYNALKNLPDPYPGTDFWKHLVICWVDERHVPHQQAESNSGNAYRYFWRNIEGPTLLPVPWKTDVEASGNGYQEVLLQHGICDGNDIDITVLGMGTDGHTASLFPGSKSLHIQNSNITTHIAGHEGIDRITMTYPMINRSQKIKIFAYGSEKGATFRAALKEQDKQKYPVMGITSENCTWYADESFYKSGTK